MSPARLLAHRPIEANKDGVGQALGGLVAVRRLEGRQRQPGVEAPPMSKRPSIVSRPLPKSRKKTGSPRPGYQPARHTDAGLLCLRALVFLSKFNMKCVPVPGENLQDPAPDGSNTFAEAPKSQMRAA